MSYLNNNRGRNNYNNRDRRDDFDDDDNDNSFKSYKYRVYFRDSPDLPEIFRKEVEIDGVVSKALMTEVDAEQVKFWPHATVFYRRVPNMRNGREVVLELDPADVICVQNLSLAKSL